MSLDQTGLEFGRFLSYLSQRQQVVASNIANADTPGYQTKDVELPADFSAALSDAGDAVVETAGLPSRNDGNNVSIDREARLLSENTLKFNMTVQVIRGELKSISSAIQEGRA